VTRCPFSVIERHNEESFEQRDYYNKAVEREALLLFEVGYEEPFCTAIAAALLSKWQWVNDDTASVSCERG
jgi:hypothetical protein